VKQGFWSKDWFAALAFSAAFVMLAYVIVPDSFSSLERYSYDLGVRSNSRAPSDRIAIVAIDDDSIAKIGRYPWPRGVHAQMLDRLRESGAKVVASAIFFSESQDEPGLAALSDLSAFLDQSALTQTIPGEVQVLGNQVAEIGALTAARPTNPSLPVPADIMAIRELGKAWSASTLATQYATQMGELRQRLESARGRLSSDDSLGAAMRSFGADLLPMMFTPGRPQGNPDKPMPDYVSRFALTNLHDNVGAVASGVLPMPTISADLLPLPDLGHAAAGMGHLLFMLDSDGVVREEPLAVQYFGELYPSLSLMTAAAALNIKPDQIEVRLGEGVLLGGVMLETTPQLQMRTHFYGDVNGRPPFPVYSFYDVREGKIQKNALKDKIVLIGATAAGTGDALATPVSASVPPVVMLAHSVSSILQGHYFTEPSWSGILTALVLILAIAYLAVLLPMLTPTIAFAVSAGLVLLLLLSEFWLLASSALWIQLTVPALLVVAGHLFMTVKKLRITEKLKLSSDAESAESNKMLGLAFQGQGQLDMAFDKFKRVHPVDDKLLDLLYNLALDFERKRQFNKAESVYQFIASKNKDFRDVQSKQVRAKKLSDTVILGGGMGSHTAEGTLLLSGEAGMEQPMLGRYQVEKELGKGAMGVVYQGRDPKIGRRVAIKTMALSSDFASDDLNSVKDRFFREAEAAGNLSHPHIVQIFDAGEEHDLAYIAMEFIQGHDLVRHTRAPNLLPVAEVIKYIADAADALDYAHSRNIVHRDIKPANLMLVEQTKTIKVTDFGVARITDASKTKTGMVLGTPSYMSPEQLSGKKVDGRSDLFSLGVTLYQLLTGSLPFMADSMATLMFKIANDKHEPATTVRSDLPRGVDAILDRALEKHDDRRYARGADFARDLRALLAVPA
jgi:serine/threonine-protein kinase